MAELELMPPPVPGEKRQQQEKKGFFEKFLFKDKKETEEPTPDEVNLDEIKRKLGLDEVQETESETAPEEPRSSFERPLETVEEPVSVPDEPAEKIDIPEWSETEDHSATSSDSDWSNGEHDSASSPSGEWDTDEQGAHHEAVDKHLATETKKLEAVTDAVEEEQPLQDWHVQDQEVPEGEYFITRNGHKIRSLQELMDVLEYVDDETFSHHMNEHQNDFANWIESAVGNKDLASAFREDHSREHAVDTLKDHHKKSKKKLDQHVRKHEKKIEKLKKLETDLPKLQKKVQTKVSQAEDETHAAHKRMKDAVQREVDLRLADERHALDAEKTQLHSAQTETEQLLAKAHAEHDKLDARKQRATDRETKLREQREQLMADKAESKELLKDSKKVKKDLQKIEKYKEKVQQQLKEITSREAELSRSEETLKQREKKMSQDITKLSALEGKITKMQTGIDARETACSAKEKEALAIVKDAEKRTKQFKAQEDKSVSKIKAEKKKLEDVRKKIEMTLKKVIKNKDRAVYAKQLRQELEKHILDIKDDVISEHKEMDKDAYKAFIEMKEDTTPIGQPSSHSEDDVKNVEDLAIFKKVEKARKALHKKNLDEAKKYYNELRDDFNKEKGLKEEQKNVLYISIRELYDDIHLAMLEH